MKHPDWPAFVAAVTAEPDDDTHRLVAADFLEENGEPARAEFIRIQCALARLEASNLGRSLEANELRKKERAFLSPNSFDPRLWGPDECRELVRVTTSGGTRRRFAGADRLVWRRGFVEEVCCPATEWVRHGVSVRTRNPVREVFLRGCMSLTRDEWDAGLAALRGLRRIDLNSDMMGPVAQRHVLELVELSMWLSELLPETVVDFIPF